MRAKKSLGQHFLRSEKALASIVRAGELTPEDVVLEIGPGEGVLTQKLLACSLQLIAVEKDDGLYESLKAKFQKEITSGQLTLVHGDILDFKPQNYKLQATSYKLIANIPYNITGQILRKFLSLEAYPDKIVLLVQKEVALRIIARDGKESILSISIKAYGKPKYIETVKAGSFAPAPNVDSAIIAIEGISKEFFLPAGRHGKDLSERAFFEALRAGFSSKRKKLSSNLSAVLPKDRIKEIFNELEWNENVRAEDISIEDWRKIAVYFNV